MPGLHAEGAPAVLSVIPLAVQVRQRRLTHYEASNVQAAVVPEVPPGIQAEEHQQNHLHARHDPQHRPRSLQRQVLGVLAMHGYAVQALLLKPFFLFGMQYPRACQPLMGPDKPCTSSVSNPP